jgi:hypothetical protein
MRKIWLQPEDTLKIVSERINTIVVEAREKECYDLDVSVDFLMKMPDFLTSIILKLYLWAVHKGLSPKKIVDGDALFSSAVVSNLGTFGLNAPLHHLYEWGTTSVFLTVGRIRKTAVIASDGTIAARDIIDFGFTVDERICDGKTIADALNFFKVCIENPLSLYNPPGKVSRE